MERLMTQTKLARWQIFGLVMSLLILLLVGKFLTQDGSQGATVSTGEYQVSQSFPEAIKVGRNPVNLKLLDSTGIPVSGAHLEISSIAAHPEATMESHTHMMSDMPGMNHGMHAMNNMPGMNPEPIVARSHGFNQMPGDYFAVIPFSTPGQWTLNTHSIINGQTLDANFPIKVVESHTSSFVILAGFAGLNVLIIWIAFVNRRKAVIAERSLPTAGGL